jgi:hypothetical protein
MLDRETVNLFGNTFASTFWMHGRTIRFTVSYRTSTSQGTSPILSGLFIYFINRPVTYFPCLLFQTRYGTNCFARRTKEDGAGSVFLMSHTPVEVLLTSHKARYIPRETTCVRVRGQQAFANYLSTALDELNRRR